MGHTPDFPGANVFKASGGQIIHPQFWDPETADVKGKKVVVIGSGATAVTIVPNIADDAAHVTMLQRSPTYMVTRPGKESSWMPFGMKRWSAILGQIAAFQFCQMMPETSAKFLVDGVGKAITRAAAKATKDEDGGNDEGTDRKKSDPLALYPGGAAKFAADFTPKYKPWDQRLCLVPDSDFFNAVGTGAAEVVTDHIDTFDEEGINLKSGKHLPADIVVTATGLTVQKNYPMSDLLEVTIDGKPYESSESIIYKG